MSIDELTIGEAKKLVAIFGEGMAAQAIDNGMIGKYVIVRCRDAGVHAGVLESYSGRECVLNESRRLWYWMPNSGAAFLSGVATEGLHPTSKIGAPVKVHLTENCEIIECTTRAEASIREVKNYEP